MELKLKPASQYTIFNTNTIYTPTDVDMEKFILVSDFDEWSADFRNGDGLTGIQHDGAPRVYASLREADEAAEQIKAIGNPYLFGIYQCGKGPIPGKLVHNFNPPVKDVVEGYADAGSW